MLIQRLLTALILVGAVIGLVLYAPPVWAGVTLGAFWLLGVWEWVRFARMGQAATAFCIVAFAVLMVATAPLVGRAETLHVALAVAGVWWLAAFAAVLSYPLKLGAFVTLASGLAALLPAWVILAHLHTSGPDGPKLVLGALCIVWGADVGAYLVGRSLGRHKLAPRVSPGKTWEGVLGGVALAGAVGYVFSRVMGWPALPVTLTGVVAGLGSVLGDLTVSMFKRNCGLKDSSRLLPGHGGVLDRIDSLTSAVTVFAAGCSWAGLIA